VQPNSNLEYIESKDFEHAVKSIIKKRKLFVQNIEDFIQEVRIRAFKYGLKYGKTLIAAVASHVCYAHKSYKEKEKTVKTGQLSDDYDRPIAHNDFDIVDLSDEIEHIRAVKLSPKERKVFDLMLHKDNYTLDQIGKKMKPKISRQYVCEMKASIIKKVREHYGIIS
jgi:hypothetical protein